MQKLPDVEDLTRSIIREFLILNNLTKTLEKFNEEDKKPRQKITKKELVNYLAMGKLVQLNKESNNPYQSLIELLVNYFHGKFKKRPQKDNDIICENNKIQEDNLKTEKNNLRPNTAGIDNNNFFGNKKNDFPVEKKGRKNYINNNEENFAKDNNKLENINNNNKINEIKNEKTNKKEKNLPIKNIEMRPNTAMTYAETTNLIAKKTKIQENNEINQELDEFDDVFNFYDDKNETKSGIKLNNAGLSKLHSSNIEPEKIRKEEKKIIIPTLNLFNQPDILKNYSFQKIDYFYKSELKMQSKNRKLPSLEKSTCQKLNKLLFGSTDQKILPKSWQQGFIFTEKTNTFFGLVQKEGGPCGVLACVQAYLLKHMLFFSKINEKLVESKMEFQLFRKNCLLASLSDILWKIASSNKYNSKSVYIVISEGNSISIENCGYMSYDVKSLNDLFLILQNHQDDFIGQFNNGVALFLYSAILTKGIDNFINEMDLSDNHIIGLHSTCTQEIVNLLLTGEATSNCIDGVHEVDQNYIIRGVKEKSDFGFMTLLEHFNYTKVEQNYKTPLFPIWVICKEYHYCVCFSNKFEFCSDDSINSGLELVFYDGFNHPFDYIVLVLSKTKEKPNEKEIVPSLNQLLMTKWGKDLKVDWVGIDPIL